MWLSLLLVLLIVGITIYQSTHGLFSALIMTVLTLCCAAAAYGSFEWVAIHWLCPAWRPDYGFALALGLTFGVPLLILRVAADRLIGRTCLLPAFVDRLGGAVCGFVTAMVMVGVIASCLQMLPFNETVLGYARVPVRAQERKDDAPNPEPPDPKAAERELWLKPDRFAFAVASMLSDGVFSGRRSLGGENPDFVQAMGWLNTVPSEVSRYAAPGSISVVRTRPLQFVYRHAPGSQSRRAEVPDKYELEKPKSDHEFRMVRVKLRPEARDARKSYVFTLRQFRLVGREFEDGPLQQYHAMAIQQDTPAEEGAIEHHISTRRRFGAFWPVTTTVFAPRDGNNNEVEVVFEVPRGFQPEYIEYKRGAQAALSFEDADTVKEPSVPNAAPDQTASAESASTDTDANTAGPAGQSRRAGGARRFTTRGSRSFFGEEMPVTMTSYRQLKQGDISRGMLVDGHLVGNYDEQEDGTDAPASKFSVPPDKRLLHLSTEYIKARSGLGRALSFAVRTVQNYTVQDADGRRYQVIGKYAIADVGAEQVVEIQYFSHQAGSMGGLGRFDKIKDRHLKGDYELVLLFLVEPGAHIVSFSTGGPASPQVELGDENLIAPR